MRAKRHVHIWIGQLDLQRALHPRIAPAAKSVAVVLVAMGPSTAVVAAGLLVVVLVVLLFFVVVDFGLTLIFGV